MDGHIEPLVKWTADEFDRMVQEEVEMSPLCGTQFGNPPEIIECACFILTETSTGRKAMYVFGSPWRTPEGYLRLEYVPDDCDGIEGECDMATL